MSNDNNSLPKVCIEVFADNHIENLTAEVQNAIRSAVGADSDTPLDECVSVVVTGASTDSAISVIQHALDDAGLDTSWRSDAYNKYAPKVDSVLDDLDVEDYQHHNDPERTMELDAYRRASEKRAWSLVNGYGDMAPVDEFVVIFDNDGANKSARSFIDNILAEGGSFVPVPVEGVSPDDREDAEGDSSAESEALADAADSAAAAAPAAGTDEDDFAEFLD